MRAPAGLRPLSHAPDGSCRYSAGGTVPEDLLPGTENSRALNCLGREKGPEDSIPALLVRQVQSSVYMEDTIRRMEELGAEALVEIGPGNALTGFVNRTLPQMPVYPVETVADVTGLPQWLAQTEKEKHL